MKNIYYFLLYIFCTDKIIKQHRSQLIQEMDEIIRLLAYASLSENGLEMRGEVYYLYITKDDGRLIEFEGLCALKNKITGTKPETIAFYHLIKSFSKTHTETAVHYPFYFERGTEKGLEQRLEYCLFLYKVLSFGVKHPEEIISNSIKQAKF